MRVRSLFFLAALCASTLWAQDQWPTAKLFSNLQTEDGCRQLRGKLVVRPRT